MLPTVTRDRLAAAAMRLGKPIGRYTDQSVMGAAKRLTEDFWQTAGLSADMSPDFLTPRGRRRARAIGVGEFDARENAAGLDAQIACLEGVLSAIEAGSGAYMSGAQAWAAGDIAGALATPAGDRWWRCAQPYPAVVNARVKAIDAALQDARVTVAVATSPLHPMVIKGGVVEQLRALGYEVTDPAGLSSD